MHLSALKRSMREEEVIFMWRGSFPEEALEVVEWGSGTYLGPLADFVPRGSQPSVAPYDCDPPTTVALSPEDALMHKEEQDMKVEEQAAEAKKKRRLQKPLQRT